MSHLSSSLPATSFSLDSVVSACDDHVSCDLKGEAAILNLKDGVYYTLNPVGARIWELVQHPTTVRTVRDTITSEYEVEAARCEADLQLLLQDLSHNGLLHVEHH